MGGGGLDAIAAHLHSAAASKPRRRRGEQNITGFSPEACEHLHANGALKALEELLNDDDPALAEFASAPSQAFHTNLGETLGPTSGETEAALNRRRALDVAAAMQQRSAAKVMRIGSRLPRRVASATRCRAWRRRPSRSSREAPPPRAAERRRRHRWLRHGRSCCCSGQRAHATRLRRSRLGSARGCWRTRDLAAAASDGDDAPGAQLRATFGAKKLHGETLLVAHVGGEAVAGDDGGGAGSLVAVRRRLSSPVPAS